MSKRRKFSAEFKRGAVEQASQPGVSCAQVGRELGIRDTLLTRWKREAQSQGAVAFGGAGTPRDEEMARLKRERAGPPHEVPVTRCGSGRCVRIHRAIPQPKDAA
jgi:transposase